MQSWGTSLRVGPARFDVSSQYAMQRRAFIPIFVVLGVGLILVEVLLGLSVARDYPHAPTAYITGTLVLPAVCFAAAFGFLVALLQARAIREILIDDQGIHILRVRGGTVDHEWRDPHLHLEFWERTQSLGVRYQPLPDHVRVVARGFPFDLEVPSQAYQIAVARATGLGLRITVRTKEHHGRFGSVYWWVTTLGKGT